jgi:hypothetical protein
VGDYSRNSACTQNLLSTGTWYHVVGTFNNSVVALYVNGKLNATKNYNATSTSNISSNTLEICRGYGNNTYNFNGTVDDVQIYNYSLAPAQVLASYQNKTNVIVSNELTVGDVWKTCVIPNDGKIDGVENCSNNVTIASALVDVYDLSLIYTNSSHYSVLRFFMRNIASYSNLFNWSLYTGESVIQNTLPINLTANENVFVFAEQNYSASGAYAVEANGTSSTDKDREEKEVVVG